MALMNDIDWLIFEDPATPWVSYPGNKYGEIHRDIWKVNCP